MQQWRQPDYLAIDHAREKAGIPLYPVGHPQHNPQHSEAFARAHHIRQQQQQRQPWTSYLNQQPPPR